MHKLILSLLLLFLLSSCAKDKVENSVRDLSILSLNAFLLDTPDLTAGPSCESDCIARAEGICQVLTDNFEKTPDVIFFQEVFESDACSSLNSCLDALGYKFFSPCLEHDPNWENSCLVKATKSSGLFIASKFPLKDYSFNSFSACNGCVLQGGDCQANKGFQYANISLSGNCNIHLINTHLDAGSNATDKEARTAQVIQITDYVNSKSLDKDAVVIYGGDLNTTDLSELLEVELRLSSTSLNQEEATSASGLVLDHILYSATSAFTDGTYSLAQDCQQGCVGWFDSDHIGIVAEFKLTCL